MLVRRPVTAFDLSPAAFDRTFQQLVTSLTPVSTGRTGPVVRATDADGTLTLTVDLPGVPAEAVGVEVAERTLTVQVDHDGLRWSRRTRVDAQYDVESVTANYVDGRLTVTVGAAPAPQARKIAVGTTAPAPAVEAGATTEAPAEVAAGEATEA